ncbi:MAG: phosphopentomutase, partial [Propionicimonas sp.]
LGSLVAWSRAQRGRELAIGNLAAIGLAALRPDLALAGGPPAAAVARRSALGYPGADTFAGHQTMMGADMSHVVMCRVGERMTELTVALESAGHRVELFEGDKPLLVVDDVALVHDNLEADPGLNWNVSARLDELPWERILQIATLVRQHAPVARVIAVGGHSDRPLAASVRPGADGTIGLDTPASGFYRLGGLQVQHLGVDIDHERQLPQLADSAGLPVTLVGKAADILVARGADYRPGVETDRVLADAAAGLRRGGLTVANVQQTDLAGHQQDTVRYAALIEQVDAAVPALLAGLGPEGLLVVTGDHGNDPAIGHPFHTREFTPVLAVRGATEGAFPASVKVGSDLSSLADIGAGAAAWLGLDPGQLGIGDPVDLTT